MSYIADKNTVKAHALNFWGNQKSADGFGKMSFYVFIKIFFAKNPNMFHIHW